MNAVLPGEAALFAAVARVLKACPHLCQTLLVPVVVVVQRGWLMLGSGGGGSGGIR